MKYQKEQTVSRLKKAYSTLAQTTNKAIADYGPMSTWEFCEDTSPEAAYKFASKYLIPYLNISKDCKTNISGDCQVTVSNMNSSVQNVVYSSHFFLNDGTMIFYYPNVAPGHNYLRIFIDINGTKKPNKCGKDVFYFMYYIENKYNPASVGKFYPNGLGSKREVLMTIPPLNSCNKNGYGWYCAAVIMMDGWKISDDYPW